METELILGLATIGALGMGFILKIGSESGRTTKWSKEFTLYV